MTTATTATTAATHDNDTTLQSTPFARMFRKELQAIRQERDERQEEYFTHPLGVKPSFRDKVPYDLRDVYPSMSITHNNMPLNAVIKTGIGDDNEIGYGGSSLVESLFFYAHPFITFASMLLLALGFGSTPALGFLFFFGVQAAYAASTVSIFDRNWSYNMRATVTTTVSVGVLQVIIAALLPQWWAAPLLALGNVIVLARPFLEGRQVSRGLGQRPLEHQYVNKPNFKTYRANRDAQILAASDLSRNGAYITMGYASGLFHAWGHPYAPIKGLPVGGSMDDFSNHYAGFGASGTGKTVGQGLPFAQQVMGFGFVGSDGKWRNCGGIFCMDGKGELGHDVISYARKMGVDKCGVELIEIGPGCSHQIAPIEGLSPTEIASSLAEMNDKNSNGNPFFNNSAFKWVLSAATLMAALRDREIEWMDDIARTKFMYVDPVSGQQVFFKSREHLIEVYTANGKEIPKIFKRRFLWTYSNLITFCKSYVMDKEFLYGYVDPDAETLSTAPKVPVPGGAIAWVRELSYYKNRTKDQQEFERKARADEQAAIARGDTTVEEIQEAEQKEQDQVQAALARGDKEAAEVIRLRKERGRGLMLHYALIEVTESIPKMDGTTLANIRSTVASWIDIATGHDELSTWLEEETGADVTAALRGAVVAISMSRTEHGVPGAFFIDLAKRRFFRSVLTRPADWRKDVRQRPVLLLVDEASDFVGRGGQGSVPEKDILYKARSKGAIAFYMTQNINQYEDQLGTHGARAFVGNFNSFFTFGSTLETLEWARDRIGKYPNITYSWSAKRMAQDLMDVSFTDDDAAMDRLYKQRAFAMTYPTDVVLSDEDKKELKDDGFKGHTALHMRMRLVRMFSIDLLWKLPANLKEAVTSDGKLVAKAVSRVYHRTMRKDGAKTLAAGEKKVMPVVFTATEEGVTDEKGTRETPPVLNADRLKEIKGKFVAIASFKRGGVVREDIIHTIKSLDFIEQEASETREAYEARRAVEGPVLLRKTLQELAALQPGVVTSYDVIEKGIAYAPTT
ncbi:TPA: TraM recognition domain-containing protein [Burkholderia vietnamiensis]|nr:TraM recognition domain-containing protein [Burkholderia vietnamiensis]